MSSNSDYIPTTNNKNYHTSFVRHNYNCNCFTNCHRLQYSLSKSSHHSCRNITLIGDSFLQLSVAVSNNTIAPILPIKSAYSMRNQSFY